jgi:hypothetical protein
MSPLSNNMTATDGHAINSAMHGLTAGKFPVAYGVSAVTCTRYAWKGQYSFVTACSAATAS